MYGCRGQALSVSHVWLLQLHRCTNVACRNLSSRLAVDTKFHIHIYIISIATDFSSTFVDIFTK